MRDSAALAVGLKRGRVGRLWNALGAERREVLRGSFSGIAMRMFDAPARYGFHLLVANELGAVHAGLFYLAFSTVNLVCGAGRLGIDYAMTRDVSASTASFQFRFANRIIRRGFLLVTGFSALVTLALLLAAPYLAAHLFHKPELTWPLHLLAFTVLPLNIFVAAAGVLAGLKRVAQSQMLYGPLWPILWCVAALVLEVDIEGAVYMLIVSQVLTAVVGLVLVARALPPMDAADDRTPEAAVAPKLLGLGWSLFIAETVQLLISTAPILLLGAFVSSDEVGRFAFANRLTMIVTIIMYGVATIASSKFAELNRLGDRVRLTQTVRMVAGVVAALTVPLLAIMALVPHLLMGIVGAEFEPGAPLLRVLAIGYLAPAFLSAMPILLGMAGFERDLRNVNYLALVCLFGSGLILIPSYGTMGAAIATALTVVLNSVLSAVMVYRRLGISPLSIVAGARLLIRRR